MTFGVSAIDAEDLTLLTRVLGDTPADDDIDVHLDIADPPELPTRPPDFEGPYGDHWDDGRTHHFRHSWGLSMAADANSVRLGGTARGFDRWVTVRNSMLFALARVFLARGRFVLHGAAVRHGDGGVLVVGDSGTGKSSLAWAASRHGWSVLGDDMVVVDRPSPSGPLQVQGIPRVPSVPGDLARVERIEGSSLPGDERERIEITDFSLDQRRSEVVAVLVCSHSSGEATLERLPGHLAMQELVPAFVLSALGDPLRRWFPLAAELARRRCYQFGHAADPDARVRAVGQRLAALASSENQADEALAEADGSAASAGPSIDAQRPNRPETTASK